MALPDNDQNINQTSAGFIKKLPLIASFALKRQAGTDPLVQLGIWSAALAERLGKLQGSGETESGLMAIPEVTVVGHDWKVYYLHCGGWLAGKFLDFLSSSVFKSTHSACDARRTADCCVTAM